MPGLTEAKVRIAGIAFSLVGPSDGWVWADRERFEIFPGLGYFDTVLRVHESSACQRMIGGDLVLTVEGMRNIYLGERTWTFEFCPYDRDIYPQRLPHQVLVFDRRFSAGDLYVSVDTPSEQPTFSFRLFLSQLLTAMLPFHDGLMIHASGVSDNGRGIVFAGPSGAGKSTMAALCQHYAGARVLNDDQMILRRDGARWWAYAVPGVGEPLRSSPEGVALDAVFLLSHAVENAAQRVSPSRRASSLLPHVSLPTYDGVAVNAGLRLLDELVHEVPIYGLGFSPDHSAVNLVRDMVRQPEAQERAP